MERNLLLRNSIRKAFGRHSDIFQEILGLGDVVAFGGVVRDLLFFKKKTFRDIDLVVSDTTNEMLFRVLDRFVARRTRFGGLQCKLKNTDVDVWALNDTWAIKRGYFPANISSLPSSVFLSTDAIIMHMQTGELIEHRFTECLLRRQLDIIFEPNPYPALCVLRAFVSRKKYGLHFSNRLRSYIYHYAKKKGSEFFEDLYKMQLSHYRQEVLTDRQIVNEMFQYVLEENHRAPFLKYLKNSRKLPRNKRMNLNAITALF